MRHQLKLAVAEVRVASGAGPDQVETQRQILEFCAEHPDALYRSCLEGHLTGSALIVDPKQSAVLLIHHKKLGRWLQPGGHVDGQGDLGAAALREAQEETGIEGLELIEPAIDLDIHAIPSRGPEPAHRHFDVRYLVLAPPDAVVSINDESLEARWVTTDDPDGLIASAELRRLVDRGLSYWGLLLQTRLRPSN